MSESVDERISVFSESMVVHAGDGRAKHEPMSGRAVPSSRFKPRAKRSLCQSDICRVCQGEGSKSLPATTRVKDSIANSYGPRSNLNPPGSRDGGAGEHL